MQEKIAKLKQPKDLNSWVKGQTKKTHRFDMLLPHDLWLKLNLRRMETGDSIRKQIVDILYQTID